MAKEKSFVELQAEREAIQTRFTAINTARETRDSKEYTPEERTELTTIEARMHAINMDVAMLNATDLSERSKQAVPEKKPFSLRAAILAGMDERYANEETRAYNEAGSKAFSESGVAVRGNVFVPIETRDTTADYSATGAAGKGSDLISTAFMDILPALRERLVIADAGATMLTGLRSNIDIPAFSGASAGFVGENKSAPDGGGTFTHVSLKPKRLTATITESKQLLLQDTLSVENLLRSDLIAAIASSLQAQLLGNAVTDPNKPDGMFVSGVQNADLTWANIVDMETSIDLNNALDGNLAYIMATGLYGLCKVTSKTAVQQAQVGVPIFLLDGAGKELNGYKALRTSSVATTGTTNKSYGIAFGNWADYVIAQWGGIDLTIDPYTLAGDGAIKITVNSYWDAKARRDKSFTKRFLSLPAAPTNK